MEKVEKKRITIYPATPETGIDFPKLMRQRKWTGDKTGRLYLYIAIYDIVMRGENYPRDALEFVTKKIDMLDEYENTEFCEIWYELTTSLYKLQGQKEAASSKFSANLSLLSNSIRGIKLYDLVKNHNVITDEKARNIIFSVFIDPPELIGSRARGYARNIIIALKQRRAVQELYNMLGEIYDKKIFLIEQIQGDLQAAYYDRIAAYEKEREALIQAVPVYMDTPTADILPHIDIEEAELSRKLIVNIKSQLRRPLYDTDMPLPQLNNLDFFIGDLIDGHRRTV